jgi:hypothetical protein
MVRKLALIVLLTAGSASCKSEKLDPAPLAGGETITYATENVPGTITIEKSGEGFVIKSPGYPEEEVGANLRDGRKRIQIMNLNIIWLEPSQRFVGGQTPVGNVVAEEIRQQRPTYRLAERNGNVEYWFDRQTGFLVERRVNPSGPTTQLLSSTVPELRGALQ